MIEANRGNVKLDGSYPYLLTELTCIMKSLRESYDEFTKEKAMEVVDLAFKSDEEIAKEAKSVLKKLVEMLLSEDD